MGGLIKRLVETGHCLYKIADDALCLRMLRHTLEDQVLEALAEGIACVRAHV